MLSDALTRFFFLLETNFISVFFWVADYEHELIFYIKNSYVIFISIFSDIFGCRMTKKKLKSDTVTSPCLLFIIN